MSQVPDQTPENLTRADIVRLSWLIRTEAGAEAANSRTGAAQAVCQGITGTQLNKNVGGQSTIEGYTATEPNRHLATRFKHY